MEAARKTFVMKIKARAVVSSSATSPRLEMARGRLQNHMQSKFSPSLVKTQGIVNRNPLMAAAAESDALMAAKKKKNLDAARARLRNRFQEKFPLTTNKTQPAPQRMMWNNNDTPAVASTGLEETPYLSAARSRIQDRFQKKFLPDFTDFPSTLYDAMLRMEDKEWGKHNAVIITDRSYKILAVNSCWEQMCGYSQAEATGKTLKGLGFSDSSFTNPITTRALTSKLEQQGESTAAAYLTNRTKDGRIFTNYLRVKPLFHHQEEAIAYLGVVQADKSFSKNMSTNV